MIFVASCVEAWIEIVKAKDSGFTGKSPPSRRRGLKSDWVPGIGGKGFVASFVEAWIEIASIMVSENHISSPPLWRRGLKWN